MTIELKNIVKRFGAFAALNGVDLKVEGGELLEDAYRVGRAEHGHRATQADS